jgi:hypothetical protein
MRWRLVFLLSAMMSSSGCHLIFPYQGAAKDSALARDKGLAQDRSLLDKSLMTDTQSVNMDSAPLQKDIGTTSKDFKKADAAIVSVASGTCSDPYQINLANTDIIEVDTTNASVIASTLSFICNNKQTIVIDLMSFQFYRFKVSCFGGTAGSGYIIGTDQCFPSSTTGSNSINCAITITVQSTSRFIFVCLDPPGKVRLTKI